MELLHWRTRKRLIVKQRRCERVYKGIDDMNMTFYKKGEARKWGDDFFA